MCGESETGRDGPVMVAWSHHKEDSEPEARKSGCQLLPIEHQFKCL